MGAGAAVGAYAFLVEPNWIEWHQEVVTIPGLSPSLSGMSVIQLTDTHVPSSLRRTRLARMVDQCNGMNPDLLVLTGDLIESRSGRGIEETARILGRLRARFGVVGILGGHDYRYGFGDRIHEALVQQGIRILHNEAVAVGTPHAKLWIAGMDDNSDSLRADLNKTLRAVPCGEPYILLMHSPDSIERISKRNVPLALAGHTHGGQVCLPGYGPLKTMSRFGRLYATGRRQVGSTVLYTCRGVGSHLHVRLFARPEIVRFTLLSHPAHLQGCSARPGGA